MRLSREEGTRRIAGIMQEYYAISDTKEALICLAEAAPQLSACRAPLSTPHCTVCLR